MALVKKKTRKKLSKQLNKLVRKHGPDMTLALVTGMVSNLAADKAPKKTRVRPRTAVKRAPNAHVTGKGQAV
ncbi:MAG: hypothetical protein ACRD15_19200 [Vicinamibacterales bacterium]